MIGAVISLRRLTDAHASSLPAGGLCCPRGSTVDVCGVCGGSGLSCGTRALIIGGCCCARSVRTRVTDTLHLCVRLRTGMDPSLHA